MKHVEQTVQIDMTDLASKPREVVEAMVANCTTNIQVKFDFDPKDSGHTIIFGTTREGMSSTDVHGYQRLRARLLSSGGWTVGEKFDDRFDTEVGGFAQLARQWIDETGQFRGDAKPVRHPSVIVDYGDGGKRYTIDEAKGLPDLAAVLTRLQEREAAYVAFLEVKEAERDRLEKRQALLASELMRRRVRFLPIQVVRAIYAQARV